MCIGIVFVLHYSSIYYKKLLMDEKSWINPVVVFFVKAKECVYPKKGF